MSANFRLRVTLANCLGAYMKMNGRWIAVPPYHRRPKEPFFAREWAYGRLPSRRRFQDGKRKP